jgi:hypothetical protein
MRAMKRITLLNIGFNLLFAVIFVILNTRAVSAGLEETFVALALIYGLVMVFGNAIFVAYSKR